MKQLVKVKQLKAIKSLRNEAGLSQTQLADKSKVHINTIIRIEKGIDTKVSIVLNICKALNTTINELFKQDNN